MDPDSYLCRIADFFSGISMTLPSARGIFALILALALLYISGLLSASETAFFSLTTSDKEKMDEEERFSDRKIKTLLNDTKHLLATIHISSAFVNISVILLLNYVFLSVINFRSTNILQLPITIIVLTFALLIFGEIMPKIHSTHRALVVARRSAPIICALRFVFKPLISVFVRTSLFITLDRTAHNISVNRLSQALGLTDIDNETRNENKMLEGVIRFGKETVKEVMTPRIYMVDIEIGIPFREVLKCVIENGYSRIPVYEESRDRIKGILYIKDLIPYLDKGDDFKWQDLIRPALFVPETKMTDDLLHDFQSNKIQIAIVVDEFGGTSGIVTMEDLIEEIVGEINDEYDDDEHTFVKIADNVYVFEGKTLLSDFYKTVKAYPNEFDKVAGDSDTLAGLLLEMKGEFPFLHEIMNYRNFRFEILNMDSCRILKVKVTVFPPESDKEKRRNENAAAAKME